ncbi:MAG: response regulator [Rubrivivax sp.]|nr:response regulator [Rubrivivax sp.]
MIKALVEDSPVVREFLVHILGADPGIRVVGTAHDGEEAIEAIARRQPDVVTMDIHMPKMNGLDATRLIMETCPTPIVIVSGSTDPREMATTFQAIEAGALAGLLAGMAPDAAGELKLLKDMGAFTIAQDRETSAGHGMPGEAIKLDAATLLLPPEKIAATLANLAHHRGNTKRDP